MSSTRHMSFAGMNFGYDSSKIYDYKNNNRCNLIENEFDKTFNKPSINNNKGDITISGVLSGHLKDLSYKETLYIKYWAAASSLRSLSFASFGLPYPNENIAFNKDYNSGIIKIENGLFKFKIFYPNSYYINGGTKLIPPSVNYRVWNKKKPVSKVNTLKIGNSIPYRTINLPENRDWNDGPNFYKTNNKVRTQEQILLDSAYPFKSMKESKNYWGGKPAM